MENLTVGATQPTKWGGLGGLAYVVHTNSIFKVSLRGVRHFKELSAGRGSNLRIHYEIATLPPVARNDIFNNIKCALNRTGRPQIQQHQKASDHPASPQSR